ncbi:vitamin K epoxide reductase family protein, partial [Streptomyces alkaliphilus]
DLGWVMALTGVIGWLASFRLSVDEWRLLKDPTHRPSCDIDSVIGCVEAMFSRQGSVFGFPNPMVGLGAFAVVAALGLTVLGGARLHRLLWWGLNAGALAGVAFTHWFIHQSLYELGRLCPYCMVVWFVTIALFWYLTLRNLRHGIVPVPSGGRRVLTVVLENRALLLAAWYGVIAMLVLTRFREYWSGLL